MTPTVRPFLARKDEIAAFSAGVKLSFRVPVTHENSIVTPGHFRGLDLETGRRRAQPTPELRARCTFENAQARAVSVKPKVQVGDLFWVRSGQQRIDQSAMTLEVIDVNVCRLQDLTHDEALNEGVTHFDERFKRTPGSVRDWFARHWDHGPKGKAARLKVRWANNPWVWVYRVNTQARNRI